MIQSYQKILEMESVAALKLEQDRKALDKIRKILYQEKDFIIDKLITYLKRELEIDYYRYKIIDIDDNIVDILVKKDSKIFKDNIDGKEFLNFNADKNSIFYTVWKGNSVRRILRNETYLGYMIQNKETTISHKNPTRVYLNKKEYIIIPNHHVPIISQEDFDKVKERLDRNISYTFIYKIVFYIITRFYIVSSNTRNRNREYLLKGITYCHNCGNKLNFVTKTEKYKDRKYERRYAICNTATKGRCIRQYNNYDKLEKEILDYIRKVCFLNVSNETYKKVILKKKNGNVEVVNDYLSHIKVLGEKITALNKKVEQIYDDRLNRCN